MGLSDTSNGTKLSALFAVAIAAVISLGGCGDDTGGEVDAGKDAGSPTEQCIAMAAEQGSESTPETIECLCTNCLDQMTECNLDECCIRIRDCSDRTGCVGTLCYFGTPECMAIIDECGPQGVGTTLATQLGECRDSMCSDNPPDAGGKDAGGKDAGDDAGGDDAGSNDAGH
jgi:hypothetical protein